METRKKRGTTMERRNLTAFLAGTLFGVALCFTQGAGRPPQYEGELAQLDQEVLSLEGGVVSAELGRKSGYPDEEAEKLLRDGVKSAKERAAHTRASGPVPAELQSRIKSVEDSLARLDALKPAFSLTTGSIATGRLVGLRVEANQLVLKRLDVSRLLEKLMSRLVKSGHLKEADVNEMYSDSKVSLEELSNVPK
jgi:hypothetical protein